MDICKVCGNSESLKYFLIKERQLNQGDVFQYMLCPRCQTLQLNQDVADMGNYYGDNYYSFNRKSARMKIPSFIVKPLLFVSGRGFWWMKEYPRRFGEIARLSSSIYSTGVKFDNKILDVGGGNGLLASFLQKNGFKDVSCIDKFCEKSLYDNIKFKQCDIIELCDNEKYDLITFESSFEHMENPHEILDKVNRILTKTGTCLIIIPIFGSKAWDIYKEDWYQIDAPRHYFLYSIRAMKKLCKQHGLEIRKILYYSGAKQFYTSMRYKNSTLSFNEINKQFKELSKAEHKRYTFMAKKADREHMGDTAWIYIRHKF